MGRNKAFLPWGNRTLIEHLIEQLRPVTDEIVVAVKDARPFRHLPVKVVEDCVPDAHALGGLYTGLRAASHARCFVCGCDAPFLQPALIRFLLSQMPGYMLVIPRTAGGLQPLHAVYATSVLPVIAAQLRRRQWELRALVPKVRALIVERDQTAPFDRHGRAFRNLNTPEEYAATCPRQAH